MEDIEVPHFFTCPISLQIMKDPVTAVTGITYDRDGIEHWLFSTGNSTCPVTKQPLPPGSDLTPNHTLRRLIQAWCSENSARGVTRIPTPKPPLDKAQIGALLRDLAQPAFWLKVIKQLELLAAENERNRKHMAECGVSKAVFDFLVSACFRQSRTEGLEEALSVLRLIRNRTNSSENSMENDPIGENNEQIMDCFTWILSSDRVENHTKTQSVFVLRSVVEKANPSDLSRLKPEFFNAVVGVLRSARQSGSREAITHQTQSAALQIMLVACPHGQNRLAMVESGAVFELVELELELDASVAAEGRRTTELVTGILFHLCCCADGRARFLSHRGAVAAVARRMLRGSVAVDEWALMIFSLVCRFSGTRQLLTEMLEVGAVQKLCVLLQAECAVHLTEKARKILKAHSREWRNSPCIGDYHYPN